MLWVVDGGLQEAHVSLRKGTLILTNGMFSEGGEKRGGRARKKIKDVCSGVCTPH
jgi:hypothetical protein